MEGGDDGERRGEERCGEREREREKGENNCGRREGRPAGTEDRGVTRDSSPRSKRPTTEKRRGGEGRIVKENKKEGKKKGEEKKEGRVEETRKRGRRGGGRRRDWTVWPGDRARS